jgi:tetrahydromethanopterin S-methyltransferase subunit G
MFCPKCYREEYTDRYVECRDCRIPLVAERPRRIGRRIGKAVLGLLLALAAGAVLVALYVIIPGGIRFPAIILGVPAVAVAAGLFQAVTGLTIFEVNDEFPRMTPGKRFAVATALLVLLLAVLAAFYWFIAVTYDV